jgi:hypothetical protein
VHPFYSLDKVVHAANQNGSKNCGLFNFVFSLHHGFLFYKLEMCDCILLHILQEQINVSSILIPFLDFLV